MASVTTPVSSGGAREAPAGDGEPKDSRLEGVIGAVERNWAWALSGLMLLSAGLLLYMGRGLSFFYDDWDWVVNDYGGGLHTLLQAHVGNISVFPVAVYKVLFHLVGLNHYAVFRSVVIVLHLVSGGLVFVLAARRIPRVPALLAATLILFLGAAWEDLLWAFQVGYMLSITGGLATWVLLEREGRRSEIAAMLCLLVAAGSSSLGIPIMIGVAVELAWQRRWRAGWIVIIPAVLYGIWYLTNGESQITANGLINAPGFAADLAAAAFGGLVGRGLDWGRPLALLGLSVVLYRLARPRPVSARLASLLATGVTLWALTAAARSTISVPETGRYIYLGAVVIVLIGVELLREATIKPRATALAALLVGVCAITGLTVLHAGAMGLRSTSKTVTAELGALELAAAHAPPEYRPDPRLAPNVVAGLYLHTVRAIGSSPADTPAEIAGADAGSRGAADGVLLALEAPKVAPVGSTTPSSLARAPSVSGLTSGTQVQQRGCVDLTPIPGSTMSGELHLPGGGVAVRNRGTTAAALALRRFGDSFVPVGTVGPHVAATLALSRDAAPEPWHLQIASASALLVCGVAG
jgi:hypothetical protein